MSDVFISYSRKDKDFVKFLHQALTESKYNTWVDWEDIPLTADWWEEIKSGIEQADTFVFVISPDSIRSKVCGQELDHAVTHNKRLIPIVRRDGFDSELIRPALGKHNWLFFRDEDDFEHAFQSLVKTLNTDLDHVKRHTRLLVKAIEWEHQHHNPDLLMRGSELENTIQWLTQSSNKEPRSTELQLSYVNESRKAELTQRDAEIQRQKKARKAITSALIGAILSLVAAIALGLFALNKYQVAAVNEISALSTSSDAMRVSNQTVDALVEALKAAGQLRSAPWANTDTHRQTELALQRAVYDTKEWNRLEGHRSYVESVSFSPDGGAIASAGGDGTLRLWDMNGQPLKTIKGGNDFFSAVTISPDGKLIASSGQDVFGPRGTFVLWTIEGQEIRRFSGHTARVADVQFSPDGKTLVSASTDGTVKLWNVTGQELKTLRHEDQVRSVSFSPDGKLLISSSNDGIVKLWNQDGQLLKTIEAHTSNVRSVSFSPDGKTFASASADGTIKLWDLEGQNLKIFEGHRDPVTSVRFSPDGTMLVSGSGDKTVKLWSIDGEELATFRGHRTWVKSVRFSPDGKTIASASEDGTVRLWQVNRQELKTLRGHNQWVWGVNFSPDGQTLVSWDQNGVIKLWSVEGKLLKTFEAHPTAIESVQFSPDGQAIASSAWDGTIKFWTLDGQLLKTLRGHSGLVRSIDFSKDGKYLVSGGGDRTVNLWNSNGQLIRTLEGHGDAVFSVSFSPTSQTIASSSSDNTIKLWSVNGQDLKTLRGHRDWVMSVSFSPDGKMLASGSRDATIKLWNLKGELLRTLTGHDSVVRSVSFSPDGQRIVSASEDNTVRVWSVDGRELKTLRGHSSQPIRAVFSPSGQVVASAGHDQTVRLWNAETLDFDSLVARGCGWLHNYLITHPQVLQNIAICQNHTMLAQAAPALVNQGEELAKEGNRPAAIASLQTALKWNPKLELNPQQTAQVFAAKGQAELLVTEGDALARLDNISGAIAKYQEAQKLDPDLEINPQQQANQIAANFLYQRGFRWLAQGKVKEAIASFSTVQERDPTHQVTAHDWNLLCWIGSLRGHAADVMFACEKAHTLAPDNWDFRDSRGLARALTGDIQGAIADFQVLVNKTNDEILKAQRQRWIEALRQGQNPFTSEEMQSLLSQSW